MARGTPPQGKKTRIFSGTVRFPPDGLFSEIKPGTLLSDAHDFILEDITQLAEEERGEGDPAKEP